MASIAIIGSGFVGQANGKVLAEQGHRVLFVDIDTAKLAKLKEEGYRTRTPEEIQKEEHIDICFVTVPTPTIGEEIQLNAVKEAAKNLAGLLKHLGTYPIIVLKSTVPPGTTRDLFIPTLEQYSGKKEGRDFGVVFEPEYLRQATALEDARTPRMITIGSLDEHTGSVIAWLRAPFHRPIKHVSLEAAELQKYVHNILNATKITFFNEMRGVGKVLNVKDIDTVFDITTETAEASWNPRYGVRDFGPFDGACLPKDTQAFLHFAQETLHTQMPLLAATIKVNNMLMEQKKRDELLLRTALPAPPHEDLLTAAPTSTPSKDA